VEEKGGVYLCVEEKEGVLVSSRGVGGSGHGFNSLLKPAGEGDKLTFTALPIPHGTLGSQGALCYACPYTSAWKRKMECFFFFFINLQPPKK